MTCGGSLHLFAHFCTDHSYFTFHLLHVKKTQRRFFNIYSLVVLLFSVVFILVLVLLIMYHGLSVNSSVPEL